MAVSSIRRGDMYSCLVIFAALLVAATSGCATITRGANERFTVMSEPSDAIVRLSTGQTGFTPVTFTIPRKDDVVVVVTKEGYQRVEVNVPAGVSGGGTVGFLGNAIAGGLIGGAMDIGTGAALSHSPNPLKVVLVRAATEDDTKFHANRTPPDSD